MILMIRIVKSLNSVVISCVTSSPEISSKKSRNPGHFCLKKELDCNVQAYPKGSNFIQSHPLDLVQFLLKHIAMYALLM